MDFITQGVSCIDNNDGSLEAFPSGGYEPYTFIWSNYITTALNTNIQSGIYSVTVTDNNGCQYFKDVELPSNDQSCITAYSAFSPNGDQNNDYWHIDNIELYPDALETINNWYDKGHIICFFTARVESHREVTEKWLKDNGFKYHSLLMGKPRGGNYHWIDNHLVKATRYNGKFTDLIEKKVTIEVFDDGQSDKE